MNNVNCNYTQPSISLRLILEYSKVSVIFHKNCDSQVQLLPESQKNFTSFTKFQFVQISTFCLQKINNFVFQQSFFSLKRLITRDFLNRQEKLIKILVYCVTKCSILYSFFESVRNSFGEIKYSRRSQSTGNDKSRKWKSWKDGLLILSIIPSFKVRGQSLKRIEGREISFPWNNFHGTVAIFRIR